MVSLLNFSYLLAVAVKELFPEAEMHQVKATDRCFFCDLTFSGEFTASMLPLLEERMRAWIVKKTPFQTFEMVPANAAQFLEHHGEKKLAEFVRNKVEVVSLLQLDRFFFCLEDELPQASIEACFFKLVCFWPLRKTIRIIGTSASSKEILKERAQGLKTIENPKRKLEELGLISWVQDRLVWESEAEMIKDLLEKKITQLYQKLDHVFIPTDEEKKKILIEWIHQRKRGGFQFQKKRLSSVSQEFWDTPWALTDQSWGRAHDINSFLHIITKFLTIFSFDYEVVSVGKIDAPLEKALKEQSLSWISRRGKPSRLEFQVKDRLGQRWLMSSLEWDQKYELVQVTLCSSFERWLVLMVEMMDIETILNRLKQLEN